MKKIFIFGTKLHMYLCELPLIAFFVLAIIFNDTTDESIGAAGLYPLIFATGAGIIFMFVYLFRAVLISAESVRSVGLFSSRDRAIINKDKSLVLTIRPKHKIKIELFGKDDAPDLDWISKDEAPRDYVNLYRDIAVGGVGTVKRVLSAFDVPKADIDEIICSESFARDYSLVSVKKEKCDQGDTYSVKFLKTI